MIAYSIAASKLTKGIQRTIVSTDSPEIAKIAKYYGAEVPFLRPVEFAQDHSTDLEFLIHAINWFESNEGEAPDLFVLLRPTELLRNPATIDAAIEKIQSNPMATSLRSAHQVSQPPQKMFQLEKAGFWEGFFPTDPRPEYYNLPRQLFPDAYCPNGHVDILKTELIKNKISCPFGPKMMAFITPFIPSIDSYDDFKHTEYLLKNNQSHPLDYLTKNFPPEK